MLPAARISDMHVCPKTEGPKPHVGGPIIMGQNDVLIEYLPAARKSDDCICVGPTDTISQGSSSVLIGDEEAARISDSTDHGGMIVQGCTSVLIGDSGSGQSSTTEGSVNNGPGTEAFQRAAQQGTPLVCKGPCGVCSHL